MNLHIYRADSQPMTRYDVGHIMPDDRPHWITCNPRKQFRCDRCWQLRYAKNLVVQVYYDGMYVWCTPRCEPIKYAEKRRLWRKWDREAKRAADKSDAAP